MKRAVFGLVVLGTMAGTLGCPSPMSRGARAQDAVQELNEHVRFGRLQVAIERVDPEERERFTRRHSGWGSRVRIADSEIYGIKLTTNDTADVAVRIAWYRPDQQELKLTTLKQKWKDKRGSWLLVGEERMDGAPGLIGDEANVPADDGTTQVRAKTNSQFPTIRIGADPQD